MAIRNPLIVELSDQSLVDELHRRGIIHTREYQVDLPKDEITSLSDVLGDITTSLREHITEDFPFDCSMDWVNKRVLASLSYMEFNEDIVLLTRSRADAGGRARNDILELVQSVINEN